VQIARNCPKCGFGIPPPGVDAIFIDFSDSCKEYTYFVTSETQKNFKCLQCGEDILDVYRTYTVIFKPSKKIFNYFPEAIEKEIVVQTEKSLLEILPGFAIESYRDLKKVRIKAFEAVLSLVNITSLGEAAKMSNSHNAGLLSPSAGLRDKAYHTALFLVTNRSKGLMRITHPPKSMTEEEVRALLERVRNEQIFESLFDLASRIVKSKNNFDPMVEIEKLFIPELFESDVLSYVSKSISRVPNKSLIYYIIDSLLAAAALLGGHENPRSAEWVQQLIKMTYQKNNWPPRLQLSKESLQKMVSVEELFNGLGMAGLLQSSDGLRSISTNFLPSRVISVLSIISNFSSTSHLIFL
jgi:hypothetical protein